RRRRWTRSRCERWQRRAPPPSFRRQPRVRRHNLRLVAARVLLAWLLLCTRGRWARGVLVLLRGERRLLSLRAELSWRLGARAPDGAAVYRLLTHGDETRNHQRHQGRSER